MSDTQNTEETTDIETTNVSESNASGNRSRFEGNTKSRSESNDLDGQIKELRRENAKYRTRAKESESHANEYKELADKTFSKFAELEKRFDEKLTEAYSKITETNQELQKTRIQNIHKTLEVEAKNAGVVDYEVFSKIANINDLTVNEMGEVQGVRELVSKVKEDKPFLFSNKIPRTTSNVYSNPSPALDSKKDVADMAMNDKAAYQREKAAYLRKINR